MNENYFLYHYLTYFIITTLFIHGEIIVIIAAQKYDFRM